MFDQNQLYQPELTSEFWKLYRPSTQFVPSEIFLETWWKWNIINYPLKHFMFHLQASRKVSKCGYLFVAPGYDFSNPLDKTKVSTK